MVQATAPEAHLEEHSIFQATYSTDCAAPPSPEIMITRATTTCHIGDWSVLDAATEGVMRVQNDGVRRSNMQHMVEITVDSGDAEVVPPATFATTEKVQASQRRARYRGTFEHMGRSRRRGPPRGPREETPGS